MCKNETLILVFCFTFLLIQSLCKLCWRKNKSHQLFFALSTDLASEVSQESNLAKIHINTISSYSGFGGGIYKMTSIKELTGTKDFLAMEGKSCAMEAFQDCVDRKIQEKCKCNLWEETLGQVNPFLQEFHFKSSNFNPRKGKCAAQPEEIVSKQSLTKVLIARWLASDSMLMLGSRRSTLGWRLFRSRWGG